MGQIKFTSNVIMALLFSLAILIFAINFAIDNNSDISIADDPEMSSIKDSLIQEASSFKSSANSSSDALTTSTIEAGDEVTRTGGQFKVTFGNMINIVTFISTGAFQKIFGQDPNFGIFLTTLSSILVLTLGLYIWKAWRGNPD